MDSNDVSKGGSFYLQSKVYRAKELLDEFQADQRRAEQEESATGKQQQQQGGGSGGGSGSE
jgi:import inner membrane translocase subunit TIM16